MRQLESFGKPHAVQVGPMSYAGVLGRFDPFVANGFAWEIRNRWLHELTPGAIEVIAAAVARKRSPYSSVGFHPFHGAATRISADTTAFGMRTEQVLVQITPVGSPAKRTALLTGDGHGNSGKISACLPCAADTPTCSGLKTSSRRSMPTAATAPG